MLELSLTQAINHEPIQSVWDFINSYSLKYNEYEIEYFLLGKYSRKDALSIEKNLIMHLEKYMSEDRAYEIIGSLRKTIRRN